MAFQLLCHFDGTNGSTVFIDETGNAGITAYNNAQLSTTGQTFGTACGLFADAGDYCELDTVTSQGSNDFTMAGRFTPSSTTDSNKTVFWYGGVKIYRDSNSLRARIFFDDSTDIVLIFGTISTSTNYAWRLERFGSDFYAYLNGSQADTANSSKVVFGGTGLIGFPSSTATGRQDEILVDIGDSYLQGAASYTVETEPFVFNPNPQIKQTFIAKSAASTISVTQTLSTSSAASTISMNQTITTRSAGDSIIRLGGINVNSSVPSYEPIQITQNIQSVSTVSVIDLNTEPMAVKSWSAKSVLLNLGQLTVFSKSAKSGFVELGAIKVFSKAAKGAIVLLPSLTMSSKSGGLSKITSQLSVFSASSIAVIGSVVNLGKLSVSSVSAKASKVTLPNLSVFSVSAGVTLIKQKLDIVKDIVSSVVAYAMNTKTAQLTKYTNFDFLAIIRLGNNHYGVKPNGLYKFTGNTDNGTAIDARFTTHETDYGTNKLKNVAHVYLDSEDPSYCAAIVDGVEKTEQPSSFGGRKTKLARGTLGRWWQYRIRNRNAKLRVAGIEVLVEERDRRIN